MSQNLESAVVIVIVFLVVVVQRCVMGLTLNNLPMFPIQKYQYETDSNSTNVFIEESVVKYLSSIKEPRMEFNTAFIDLNGAVSSDEENILFITPNMVSNSTHGLYNLMMDEVVKKIDNSQPLYSNHITITLYIQLNQPIDESQCNIIPHLPKELNVFEQVSLFITINARTFNIDCSGEKLFKTKPKWDISIEKTRISNVELEGNFVFKKVEFGTLCKVTNSEFLFFINSKTSDTLKINSTSLKHLSFVYSNMDKLEMCFVDGLDVFLTSNSFVSLSNMINEIKTAWIYNSTISLYNIFTSESLDQFLMVNSVIIPQFSNGFLYINYARSVYIDRFTSSQPILISIEHCVSVVMKNVNIHSNIAGETLFFIRGIKSLLIYASEFKRNSAKRILDLNYVSNFKIINALFENNSARDYPISISGNIQFPDYSITNSSFKGNKAGKLGVISVFQHFLKVSECEFIENEGINGGSIYADSGINIYKSTFANNKATINGGAVYLTGIVSIRQVNFLNNQVTDLNVKKCGKENCDGSGGAIYYNQIDSFSLSISQSNFNQNQAVRGGAIYSNIETKPILVQSTQFNDNQATYIGASIYHNSAKFLPQIKEQEGFTSLGKTFASAISNVKWKVVNTNLDRLQVAPERNDIISVYPGQLFTIIPTFTDMFNNQILENQEESQIKVTGSNYTTVQSSNKEFTNLFIASSDNSLDFDSTTLTVSFLKLESNISINIQPCPKNFLLKINQFNKYYVCVYEEPKDYLIAVVVSITIVVISLILCSIALITFLCHKASLKVKYWMRRDKAEKDIEKRLLESELNPEEMTSVKSLNFVISIDQITIERKIGEGGSGIVYMGKWHHHPVAIKCLKIQESYQNSDEIEKEAALLCNFRHPNIVLFFGVSLTPQKQYLIVEYLEKGSLEKYINTVKRTNQFKFIDKLKLLIDITCGMTYLHSLKVIHRDLKPGNVLLDSLGVAKIADFGISRIAGNMTANSTTVCAGTLAYMAPELLQSESEKNRITTSVDVFSFSMIMYEMLFEHSPYAKSSKIDQFKQDRNIKPFVNHNHSITPFSIISKVIKGERPEIPFNDSQELSEWLQLYMFEYQYLSDSSQLKAISIVNDFIELMKACWSSEFEKRPNFETIFNCLSLLRQQFVELH